ncbi:MAG: PqiC family protein [Opitutaceae bacterium]|jgi:hypothetical protein
MKTSKTMPSRTLHAAILSSLLGAIVLLPGCNIIPEPTLDPTRYYTLALPAGLETALPHSPNALRIGLKPVDLAPYLKKGVLVTRESETEVSFNDYARWAEPLEASIARVLQASLSADPKVARIVPSPFPMDEERDFDVTVKIRRADGLRGAAGKSIRFVALLEISSVGAGSELVASKAFTAPEIPWDGRDYAALAKGLGEATQALAAEILSSLPEKKRSADTPAP